MNQTFEVKIRLLKRTKMNLKSSEFDGFFATFHIKKRDQFVVQSATFIKQTWDFYVIVSEQSFKTKKEIKKRDGIGKIKC